MTWTDCDGWMSEWDEWLDLIGLVKVNVSGSVTSQNLCFKFSIL